MRTLVSNDPCMILDYYLLSVYWQIKRIFVSEDQKNHENKFKTMINAIKVSNDWPKYSEVLWVVRILDKTLTASDL